MARTLGPSSYSVSGPGRENAVPSFLCFSQELKGRCQPLVHSDKLRSSRTSLKTPPLAWLCPARSDRPVGGRLHLHLLPRIKVVRLSLCVTVFLFPLPLLLFL